MSSWRRQSSREAPAAGVVLACRWTRFLLRYRDATFRSDLAVRGGFVQVLDDQVILLATEAVHPDDIDVKALKTELEAVLEKLQHPESDEQYQELLDERRWIETREKVAG